MTAPVTRVSEFFDRSGRVRRPPYRRLLGELRALLFDHAAPADPRVLPRGDGHAVLVIPAFLTGDSFTAGLRRFLTACGYRAEGWGLGVNLGPTDATLAGLRRRLSELSAARGPVSIIGVSLGGLLARDLAHACPADVRQVITLVSPCRLPTACTIEPLFHLALPFYSKTIDAARLAQPLRVPSMAIYTRDDGIVAWESCALGGDLAVEVAGAHTTICRNPQARAAVARRLAEIGVRAREALPS